MSVSILILTLLSPLFRVLSPILFSRLHMIEIVPTPILLGILLLSSFSRFWIFFPPFHDLGSMTTSTIGEWLSTIIIVVTRQWFIDSAYLTYLCIHVNTLLHTKSMYKWDFHFGSSSTDSFPCRSDCCIPFGSSRSVVVGGFPLPRRWHLSVRRISEKIYSAPAFNMIKALCQPLPA